MSKKTAIILQSMIFSVLLGCVMPEAVQTEVQGIKNDMGSLEKLVEQKADNTTVADRIEEVNNKIEQTNQVAEELSLWRKKIQAETINYGGAGWVVLGTSIVALIFILPGTLLIRSFMNRGNLLKLVTRAIKRAGENSPYVVFAIKDQLKDDVEKGRCPKYLIKSLGDFTKKHGTFAEQKRDKEV